MSYRGKRALDVVVAGAVLVVTAPALAVAAVLIRLESHGHPIYRQRRVGRDGAPFELYKLRTMVAGAESIGPGLALAEGDTRITRLGRVLRRTSLPWHDRIELDLWYVEHESLRLDLRILARTVRMVVAGHGLYKGETGGWREPPRDKML